MRRLQGGQPQLKRELFAMKLYARTGETRRNASVRFRAAHPISEHCAEIREFALRPQEVIYVANPEARNFSPRRQATQREAFSCGCRAVRSIELRVNTSLSRTL
jgi:hypothetical protein